MIDAIRNVLAVIGGLAVLAVTGLVGWVWAFLRADRRKRRALQDEQIAEVVRESSVEGATSNDMVWLNYVIDHGLNGQTPKEWES